MRLSLGPPALGPPARFRLRAWGETPSSLTRSAVLALGEQGHNRVELGATVGREGMQLSVPSLPPTARSDQRVPCWSSSMFKILVLSLFHSFTLCMR